MDAVVGLVDAGEEEHLVGHGQAEDDGEVGVRAHIQRDEVADAHDRLARQCSHMIDNAAIRPWCSDEARPCPICTSWDSLQMSWFALTGNPGKD